MGQVTPAAFRDAVFTAFDTFWAKRTQGDFPNVDFDPDELPEGETAWVRLFFLGRSEGETRFSHSVARNHFQEEGVLTIEVHVRQGEDTDQAYALALAAQQFMRKPGVANSHFFNVSTPEEIGPDGTWFQVNVSASWLYWTDEAA